MSGCAPAHKELMETMQSVYQALKYAFFCFIMLSFPCCFK